MLANAFKTLRTYDYGMDRTELNPIDEAIVEAQGNRDARQNLEQGLLDILNSDASRCAKDFACRKLKVIGTAMCVPTLAKMLGDKKSSHMARYALESIPDDTAGKALRESLPELNGELQAGVMGSLGVRQDNAAVASVAAYLTDGDPVVANAAACALGAIRTKDAANALSNARPNAAAVSATMDSSLACAESLLAGGDKSGALLIYRKLSQGDPPQHVKVAAQRGMLLCLGRSS